MDVGDRAELGKALRPESAEGVGRGLRIVGACHKKAGTCCLRLCGEGIEVASVKRIGACHDLEGAVADLHAEAAVDYGVLRMELAVCLLVGLGDALDAVDDVHGLEEERIDLRRIADDADNRLILAFGDIRPESAVLDPGYEMRQLVFGGALVYDSYHRRNSHRFVAYREKSYYKCMKARFPVYVSIWVLKVRLAKFNVSAIIMHACSLSSVDQSVRLRSERSWVRAPQGAP